MPQAALKPCANPGCGKKVHFSSRFCPDHQKAFFKRADEKRESSSKRGYNNTWRKAREVFLRSNPLCKACMLSNLVTAATDVDHVIPHKGDMGLFWDQANWQPLCHACHSRKTATEDSSFAGWNRKGRGG
jgi:5-methylcytosine-specific restriction enzyme A